MKLISSKKSTKELKNEIEKLSELIRFARLYGGSISLGGELLTIDQLFDWQESLKFEIAKRISKSKLRIVN